MPVTIGAGGNGVFHTNDTTISANTTIDTSQNWMTVGPITINSGITVTVNSGATWTVV